MPCAMPSPITTPKQVLKLEYTERDLSQKHFAGKVSFCFLNGSAYFTLKIIMQDCSMTNVALNFDKLFSLNAYIEKY